LRLPEPSGLSTGGLSPAEPTSASDGAQMLEYVRWQVSLGPRVPGSEAHRRLVEELGLRLERYARQVVRHEFPVRLPDGEVVCTNLIGQFPARRNGAPGSSTTVLIGTHFDTRLQADRERNPLRRRHPIPGANDGGSGTAVLLYLLPLLARGTHERDVTVVFFDAEDVGDIAGNPFSLGARRLVEQKPVPLPDEAVILDMVGGKNLRLDVDAHILHHRPSFLLARRLFAVGNMVDRKVFGWDQGPSRGKLRYIISDQYPYLLAGVAACLLIDLDYPQWHTLDDRPEAMAAESLSTVAAALRRYLLPARS
jgi:glutaminyl-peptide cyclotransferase